MLLKKQDETAVSSLMGVPGVEIRGDTSPELAIKIAYDFARNLRTQGATDDQFADQIDMWVDGPYRTSPLVVYVRAGFSAGYFWKSLPWRREIEGAVSAQEH